MADNVQLYCFDFTLDVVASEKTKTPGVTVSVEQLKNWLRERAKKWVFQIEKGAESGILHYQGRLTLISKQRLYTLAKECEWQWIHLSPTASVNKNSFIYVMKADTKVQGPWTDKDVPLPPRFQDIVLKPFQKQIQIIMKIFDMRGINVVIAQPNLGKTHATQYFTLTDNAIIVPPYPDFEKVLGFVHGMMEDSAPYGTPNYQKLWTIFIDMPRAMPKLKLQGMYSALETIKSGMVYDWRNKAKKYIFHHNPIIVVFTNEKPDLSLLGDDRWKLWTISDNWLEEYDDTPNIPVVPDIPSFNLGKTYEQIELEKARFEVEALKKQIEDLKNPPKPETNYKLAFPALITPPRKS